MRKAAELCALCGCDVGIFVFSPSGQLHRFVSSEQLLKRIPGAQAHEDVKLQDVGSSIEHMPMCLCGEGQGWGHIHCLLNSGGLGKGEGAHMRTQC